MYILKENATFTTPDWIEKFFSSGNNKFEKANPGSPWLSWLTVLYPCHRYLLALVYTSCHCRAEPIKFNYKLCKNLLNFIFTILSLILFVFDSVPSGHHVETRGWFTFNLSSLNVCNIFTCRNKRIILKRLNP